MLNIFQETPKSGSSELKNSKQVPGPFQTRLQATYRSTRSTPRVVQVNKFLTKLKKVGEPEIGPKSVSNALLWATYGRSGALVLLKR